MNTKNSLKSIKTQWALGDMIMGKGLLIRLLSIALYSKEDLDNDFVVNASGNKVANILKSMCPATFLRYKHK